MSTKKGFRMSDADTHFGMFVEKLLDKATWGSDWPPQNLFAVRAHMMSRAGLGPVELAVIGKGQFTTVIKVTTPHYSVAVKFMNETCPDEDIDFVTREFVTEAHILCRMEMLTSETKKHIGQFYHSTMLYPLAPILVLDSYDNYYDLCHLVDGMFHHELNFDWLMCVRQVLFHVVITLAQLQKEYPQFRHNDLKDNNVLCCLLSQAEQVPVHYSFDGVHYVIDMMMVDTKIIDFATAHSAHPDLRNTQIMGGSYEAYGITDYNCPMYDLHFFILCFLIRTKRVTEAPCVRILLQFFDDIIPFKYFQRNYINDMSRLTLDGQKEMTEDVALPYRTPAQVLTHPFFTPFRAKEPETMDVDSIICEMLADML